MLIVVRAITYQRRSWSTSNALCKILSHVNASQLAYLVSQLSRSTLLRLSFHQKRVWRSARHRHRHIIMFRRRHRHHFFLRRNGRRASALVVPSAFHTITYLAWNIERLVSSHRFALFVVSSTRLLSSMFTLRVTRANRLHRCQSISTRTARYSLQASKVPNNHPRTCGIFAFQVQQVVTCRCSVVNTTSA